MTISVSIDSVDVPEGWRKARQADVAQLANSLAREGLLHPIGVRHDADSGRYVLTYGRHRLDAARKLGWPEITATLLPPGRTEAFYASMTGAENLFRIDLAAADRVLALKRWHEGYVAEHPETAGHAAGSLASVRARSGAEPEGDDALTFVAHVADVTGMDRKTVERYLYSGKNLSEEQLLVLAQAQVVHEHLKAINKLRSDQVDAVVALVASGCGAAEAIAQATLPPGATMEDVGDPENPVAEEDLTDEEWVRHQCGEVLERLRYKAVFIADAILYRRVREARAKLRNVAKAPLSQARGRAVGPFYSKLSTFINIDHPRNWTPCGPCGATGMSGDNSKCGTCLGHAYLLRREG